MARGAALAADGEGGPPADPPSGGSGGGGGSIDPDLATMPNNGLSPGAIDANRALLAALKDTALKPDALLASRGPNEPSWSSLLAGVDAPDLVAHIVSCALDPCDVVRIPDDAGLASWRHRFPDGFPGQLGLCGASSVPPNNSPETSWAAGKPSDGCLERVSSCVLARVNAVDARVPISMRGDGRTTLQKVAVATQYRENHGTPIQSFKPCDRMCLWGDPVRRNCDWEPRYVGQCVRGPKDGSKVEKVQLKRTPGSKSRVRICLGIYGCDDVAPALGAGAATAPVFSHGQYVEFPPFYGGSIIDATASGDSVEFECPNNGPLVGDQLRTGYYSVMLGSQTPGVPLATTDDVVRVASAGQSAEYDRYPADEQHIFTYREGGFYGRIFPTGSSSPQDPSCSPPSHCDRYACKSDIWNLNAAVMEARLCAVGAGACPVNQPPGLCDAEGSVMLADCERKPAPPSSPPVYGACKDEGGTLVFRKPYTVYLNHPCDFLATDEECKHRLSEDMAPAVQGPVCSAAHAVVFNGGADFTSESSYGSTECEKAVVVEIDRYSSRFLGDGTPPGGTSIDWAGPAPSTPAACAASYVQADLLVQRNGAWVPRRTLDAHGTWKPHPVPAAGERISAQVVPGGTCSPPAIQFRSPDLQAEQNYRVIATARIAATRAAATHQVRVVSVPPVVIQ
ncbi:MAG TPA: hypothetical protein VFK02_30950 [Kofleriaceae bacterium]|nr:hypothetical protein [Kofleriaceae bacterium]